MLNNLYILSLTKMNVVRRLVNVSNAARISAETSLPYMLFCYCSTGMSKQLNHTAHRLLH